MRHEVRKYILSSSMGCDGEQEGSWTMIVGRVAVKRRSAGLRQRKKTIV